MGPNTTRNVFRIVKLVASVFPVSRFTPTLIRPSVERTLRTTAVSADGGSLNSAVEGDRRPVSLSNLIWDSQLGVLWRPHNTRLGLVARELIEIKRTWGRGAGGTEPSQRAAGRRAQS